MILSLPRALVGLTLAAILGCARGAPPEPASGLTVESVRPGFAAAMAGIEPGDLLTSWRRSAPSSEPSRATAGDLRTPFDLYEVELEEAPRGHVELLGRRQGRPLSFVLTAGGWQITSRLGPRDIGEGFDFATGDVESALLGCRRLASSTPGAAARERAIWCGVRIGRGLAGKRRWEEARAAFEMARSVAAGAPGWPYHAALWELQGRAFDARPDDAVTAWREALRLRQATGQTSLATASALYNLGGALVRQEEIEAAVPLFNTALELVERRAPGSVLEAMISNGLGIAAALRGRHDSAGEYFEKALEIHETANPQSATTARTLNSLGNIRRHKGRLAEALRLQERALAIQKRLDPEGRRTAVTLNNLGIIARLRGDLATAERHWQRSYAIKMRLRPDSLSTIRTLGNLATLALYQGNLEKAEDLHRETLRLFEAQVPGSRLVGINLNHLGDVVLERGAPETAEGYYRRALQVFQSLADEVSVTRTLNSLGRAAWRRGDLETAHRYHKEASTLLERRSPEGLLMAVTLSALADVDAGLGKVVAAETGYRKALELLRRLAPGSTFQAETSHALAVFFDRTGRPDEAEQQFIAALEALETQIGRLGGTAETRELFGADYAGYYKSYLTHLVDGGRDADAFHVLERYRARSFLEMLAQRELTLEAELPEDLAARRTQLRRDLDRTHAALRAAREASEYGEASEYESLVRRLRELEDERQRLAQRIRASAPRLAKLREPRPVDLAAARRTLDLDTVALAYAVGSEETFLFVLSSPETATAGLRVVRIPLGAPALRQAVERFLLLVQNSANGNDETLQALRERGRELYRTLVAPAEEEISAARRLLLVPDGPLYSLPFTALVRGEQYLVEWKPLHQVVSLTVYQEIRESRRDQERQPSLIAFGDPHLPVPSSAEQEATRGENLPRLSRSRDEVLSIASLFGERATAYLGRSATEARAKAVGPEVTHLHFATHGVLDARFPLSSGLVLTPSGDPEQGDNGLLQAWEIFEQIRLEAELVTLSACESALGEERAGEGLIGLTRAFQYAGARTVAASWWKISDRSTSALMARFYARLAAGESKDEALRGAQIDLIRAPVTRPAATPTTFRSRLRNLVRGDASDREAFDASAPYHWAAFQLIGDWR